MAVEEPPDGPNRQPPRSWWIAAGLLALLLVVGLVVLWVQAPALYGRGDAAKTAAATTRGAILTVAAALIAATAAGAGLYMTAHTIRINQQALAETQRANRASDDREREAQVTDRYTKAIGQLGDPQLAIRLGGIYALERIAVDSERDHRTIVEVLSAFVRNSSQRTTSNRSPDNQSGARSEEHPIIAAPAGDAGQTLTPDVQAAVSVLGRLPSQPEVPRGNLHGAWLVGGEFRQVKLAGADLCEVNLSGAHLRGADLTGARLRRANLTGARPIRAILTGADLRRADLTDAVLEGVDLAEADLTDAQLAAANLAMAKNLTQQQLDSARGDHRTKLPAGLQRPTHWSTDPAAPPAAD